MSIKRFKDFPEGSGNLTNDDIFLFMDDPSGSATTKKVSLTALSNFLGNGGSGGTSFEITTVDLHNGGVQNAQVLKFNDPSYQSVITGPTPAASGNTAQRLIIQGQRAQGNGEGGDVYVWGGDSDANGGDIKIYAGDADNVSPNNGYGGYVNIDGGRGATVGGNVEITAGYSESGQAGRVEIVGGSTSNGSAGNVVVKTNNNTHSWTFNTDGGLVLPNGNLIQSQAGQGETNIQIIDNESPFKIYTHANSNAKAWTYDANGDLSVPGNILFPNGTSVASGTFDNGMGGNGGISLNCAVGYELNWQASHLKNIAIGDSTATPQTIYVDSPLQFPGSGLNYMTINADGITFPDGSTQTKASTGSATAVINSSYSSTINTDAGIGDIFDITLTGNATLSNPTNPVNGKTLRWRITQDATGNRTVALGNKFNLPSSATTPLPWSTAANKMDVLAATYHAGRDKWDIVAFVPGY